jgi:hypothetical protein
MQTGVGSWRLCAKCACIYSNAVDQGTCPAGGPHRTFTSTEYLLPAGSGSGQGGWHNCAKCNCLFADGGGLTCSKGGTHSSAGYEYFLPVSSSAGQSDWRCCVFCSCLFYQPPGKNGGICPARAEHDKAQSRNYSIPVKA